MNKQKAEIINFVSAWVEHRVANIEEELRQLQKEFAQIRRRTDALPPAEPERFVPLR